MKRDMDLVRRLLLETEAMPLDGAVVTIEGHTEEEIAYHILLLKEAGLVDAIDLSSEQGIDWRPTRLTWAGHEFLDAARDDRRWEKAKTVMVEKAGGVVFEVIKELLVQLVKASVS